MSRGEHMKRLAQILCERGVVAARSTIPCGHDACAWRAMLTIMEIEPPSKARDFFASVIERVHGPVTEEDWSQLDREMPAYVRAQLEILTPEAHA